MVRLATSNMQKRVKNSAIPSTGKTLSEQQHKEFRFDLAHHLQSSLDLTVVLESFFEKIQPFVNTSGIKYVCNENEIDVSFGREGKHKISYKVSSDNIHLGEIGFTRDKCFTETELAVLEMLLGVLFFPLRNALLYRAAVESSMRDPLTSIGNRAAMELSFARELKLAARHAQALSILLIDVDHFKQVNDNFGHRTGDVTLQTIAQAIVSTLRETDQVYRYGGEEFVAILSNTSALDAKLIAERIRQNIATSPIELKNEYLTCTASIGVGIFEGTENTEDLLEKADAALYHAKHSGRNQVALWSSKLRNKQDIYTKLA